MSPLKESNSNAMVDNLANIPINGVKKIAKSASFSSVILMINLEPYTHCLYCPKAARAEDSDWF